MILPIETLKWPLNGRKRLKRPSFELYIEYNSKLIWYQSILFFRKNTNVSRIHNYLKANQILQIVVMQTAKFFFL